MGYKMFEAFNNYADFSGRASRTEFWLFQLLNLGALLICTALIVIGGGGARFLGIGLLVFWVLIAFVPSLSVTVRRFHDHNIRNSSRSFIHRMRAPPANRTMANVRRQIFNPNHPGSLDAYTS